MFAQMCGIILQQTRCLQSDKTSKTTDTSQGHVTGICPARSTPIKGTSKVDGDRLAEELAGAGLWKPG